MDIFVTIVKNDVEGIKLTVLLLFIFFFVILGIFYLLDRKIYYKVPEKWEDKLFVLIQFLKNLLGLMIIILLTALLSNIIAQKDIITLYSEITSKGIQSLILTGFILVICSFIYKNYRLYRILKNSTKRFLRTASKEELQQLNIRFTCLMEQSKRKLSILLKFAPGTIIAIILENLFGILKESDVTSVIDYMMTNQANIYMFSLLAVYLFWIYNTNENVKQFENKIRDINIELLRRN